jgi:glucose/arabinose dehydrogenase
MIAVLALLACLQDPVVEGRYYQVDHLKLPEDVVLEVGGMGLMPDGDLMVSTRRGQVWRIEGALAEDPTVAKASLYAEGLWEGLGLAVVEGRVYVLQRTELSELVDADGDGRCDMVRTICDDWGVSDNYHEFAFGLPVDADGNFWISLNLGFADPKWWHGRSLAPWRGWVARIAKDGSFEPWATGFRSPAGIGLGPRGTLLVTDNQGDWVPACPLVVVEKGGFHGAPAGLEWREDFQRSRTVPSITAPVDAPRVRPALWMPYKWTRSTGNMVMAPRGFAPWGEQLVLAELTNGMVLRADLEEVQGAWQGAVFVLRTNVGSAVRALFADERTLLLGLTNRGWGGLPPGHGIARVRRAAETPLEIVKVAARGDGFQLAFNAPLEKAIEPEQVSIELYRYDWFWEYGSPERDTHRVDVARIESSDDLTRARLVAPGIEPGWVARVILSGVAAKDGRPLLHDEFAYTINELPDRPKSGAHVARVAPPPAPKESRDEGWLRLTWNDATQLFDAGGFELVQADLSVEDPARFDIKPGWNALVNAKEPRLAPFASKSSFGDGVYKVDVMLPKDGAVQVRAMGRYALELRAPADAARSSQWTFGMLPSHGSREARKPLLGVWRGFGQMHEVTLDFRAPRFDASGRKVEDAKFVRVLVDDVLIHEGVDLPAPVAGAPVDEVAQAPFEVVPSTSPVGIADIRVQSLSIERPSGRDLLAEHEGLEDEGATQWSCEDGVLRSKGANGVFAVAGATPRELRLRAKLNQGGWANLWLRRRVEGAAVVGGRAIRLANSHPDPARTGTIVGRSPIRVDLLPDDTWFDLRVALHDENGGVRTKVWVNAALVQDDYDPAPMQDGGLVVEHGFEGTLLEIQDLRALD